MTIYTIGHRNITSERFVDLLRLPPDSTAGRHSQGLCLPDSFSFSFALNQSGTDISMRTTFALGGRGYSDMSCTDLRMRALGRSLLEKSSGVPRAHSQADVERRGEYSTCLALGLSRCFHGKHWLMVIGVHTMPELDVLMD